MAAVQFLGAVVVVDLIHLFLFAKTCVSAEKWQVLLLMHDVKCIEFL